MGANPHKSKTPKKFRFRVLTFRLFRYMFGDMVEIPTELRSQIVTVKGQMKTLGRMINTALAEIDKLQDQIEKQTHPVARG